MAFTQFKLEVSTAQSRGIFNQYVYETDDTIAETQVSGYFVQSRFATQDPVNWFGALITCKCSDGVWRGEIQSDGTATPIEVDNIIEIPSGDYQQQVEDDIVIMVGVATFDAIQSSTGIKIVTVKSKLPGGDVTFMPFAGDTVNGAASIVIAAGTAQVFAPLANDWEIIG